VFLIEHQNSQSYKGGKEDAEKVVDGCGIASGDAGYAFHGFLSEESGRPGPTGPCAHGSSGSGSGPGPGPGRRYGSSGLHDRKNFLRL
jgi:hypothetical protein